uniref:Uncharacterized protein n=1 Tax=Acanthochromis polyacanthus TaxID=80966 RepID=A0A3Q1EEG7_9TELE
MHEDIIGDIGEIPLCPTGPRPISKYGYEFLNQVGSTMFPDALEAVGRVEGLPLSSLQPLPELEEEETEASAEKGPKRQGRYRHSLQLLKPFRITHKHQHPIDNASLFSFMTLHWLSPLALKAYKGLSCHEASAINCQRRGREGASLTRVFWRFCQTRMLVAIFSLLLTMVAGFVGPAQSALGRPRTILPICALGCSS